MKTPTHVVIKEPTMSSNITILGAERILAATGSWSGFTSRMLIIKLQRNDIEIRDLSLGLQECIEAFDALTEAAQAPSKTNETLDSINPLRRLLAKHTKQGK